nr:hypothetical protein [Tanacetum cinerariifolium]
NELSESNTYRYSYKLGVDQLEGRLVEYKERKVKYIEKIRTLEMYRASNLDSIKIITNEVEALKEEKDVVDGKLARLLKSSKDLENIIESQRSEKVKEGVGYNAVPPPAADLYLSPKKDLSWTEDQNKDTSTSEDVASPNPPKPFIKRRVQRETNRSQNHSYKTSRHRSAGHKPNGAHMRPPLKSSGPRPHRDSMRPSFGPAGHRPHGPSMNPRRPTMNVKNPYRASWVLIVNRYDPSVNRKFSTGRRNFPTANRKFPTASKKFTTGSIKYHTADMGRNGKAGSSQNNIDEKGYWDSGCSRHMTGNISYLSDFEPFDGGYVSVGQGGCKITGKGTIKTDSECIVLGRNFKLLDDTNILLMTPRQHNMYFIDRNNIVPHKDLTCLVAKASADECILWHRRLGHLNVKTMNKLVRHNLVRGLPTKSFDNDHTCTACLKGKQHKASCKSKLVNSVTKPLHTLPMDLFGPTSVSSISHKWYCLVVTDDFSRFT